jgi:hypothetical protein
MELLSPINAGNLCKALTIRRRKNMGSVPRAPRDRLPVMNPTLAEIGIA